MRNKPLGEIITPTWNIPWEMRFFVQGELANKLYRKGQNNRLTSISQIVVEELYRITGINQPKDIDELDDSGIQVQGKPYTPGLSMTLDITFFDGRLPYTLDSLNENGCNLEVFIVSLLNTALCEDSGKDVIDYEALCCLDLPDSWFEEE